MRSLIANLMRPLVGSSQYSPEPVIEASVAPVTRPPQLYAVSIYSGGESVEEFLATDADGGYGCVSVTRVGDAVRSIVGGCFVVEPSDNLKTPKRQKSSKFLVTLFDSGRVVRQWYAASASRNDAMVYIRMKQGEIPTRIGGTFSIRPLEDVGEC